MLLNKLHAVVVHRGNSLWSGHYTAHVLREAGSSPQWYHINDDQVGQVRVALRQGVRMQARRRTGGGTTGNGVGVVGLERLATVPRRLRCGTTRAGWTNRRHATSRRVLASVYSRVK